MWTCRMRLFLQQCVSEPAGHQGDHYAEMSNSGNDAGKGFALRWVFEGIR